MKEIMLALFTYTMSILGVSNVEFNEENYIVEKFIITEKNQEELRGDIIYSSWTEYEQGEGIYLTKDSTEIFEDINVGDTIVVYMTYENYENEYWDEIERIEIEEI